MRPTSRRRFPSWQSATTYRKKDGEGGGGCLSGSVAGISWSPISRRASAAAPECFPRSTGSGTREKRRESASVVAPGTDNASDNSSEERAATGLRVLGALGARPNGDISRVDAHARGAGGRRCQSFLSIGGRISGAGSARVYVRTGRVCSARGVCLGVRARARVSLATTSAAEAGRERRRWFPSIREFAENREESVAGVRRVTAARCRRARFRRIHEWTSRDHLIPTLSFA